MERVRYRKYPTSGLKCAATILSADTIVVMEAGQIVGQGKHDELLRTCPTYKQLYERQLFAA